MAPKKKAKTPQEMITDLIGKTPTLLEIKKRLEAKGYPTSHATLSRVWNGVTPCSESLAEGLAKLHREQVGE